MKETGLKWDLELGTGDWGVSKAFWTELIDSLLTDHGHYNHDARIFTEKRCELGYAYGGIFRCA